MNRDALDPKLVEAILSNDKSLIYVKDRESRIVFANDAFLEFYAPGERDKVIGSTTTENFTEAEAELFLAEDRRAFEEGETEIVEEITDWRGERRHLCSRKVVYTSSEGEQLLLGISIDMTELRGREKALTRANRQLRDYARSVAHDLRTPIAAVISGVSIIERDPNSKLSERAEMVAEAMKDSAHGMSNHLTSMLDAAQSDSAGLRFVQTDLNMLLEEVRFNLSALLITKNATLQSNRLPEAVVEPTLFRQMLQSLIENAVRHSGVDRPVVKLRCSESEGEFVFSFFDNGPGIPQEKRAELMKPFSRVEGGHGDGYGLGLVQCQRIAQLHEGYLEIPDRRDEWTGATICAHISSSLRANGLA
ncbi:sensor histidine kinase [Aurantiacibacter gangjinensis]|uniref:sensor histidine kinase n=1 Tax=Aurantiacibacter gangjinensis TaxID=502682 RepID=UPI00069B7472|nr:PAS domain-containing sensor histidine kinase [Aurantiacibacter gangjinensis]APE27313.1 Osmosensitive K+ channel histidine kinase KdpD [Aurantiacibacter gangjinensis]